MSRLITGVVLAYFACWAHAYPLDGVERSGIQRLLGDQARPQPSGNRLQMIDVRLRLTDQPRLDLAALQRDPRWDRELTRLFAARDPSYSIVLVDFSKQENIRWAALRPDQKQNPGSVGKIVSMLALFHELARTFPDVRDRRRVLRETVVPAGDWVIIDEHAVPHYEPERGLNRSARLRPEDRFRLSEWLDHAISASANGAGSVLWRETMLMRAFGGAYPVSDEQAAAFFADTPKKQLGDLARQVVEDAIVQANLDPETLMQGSFWTRTGKARVPGGQSYATTGALVQFMLRMEQGLLVDRWSSLEMKRYLYVSKRRYRYVYAPELAAAGVYFKSGSLYQCAAEEGFRCGKYMGNVRNMMNSVTTVETEQNGNPVRYTVALMSNVLRVNSAWDHSRIAAAIHTLVTSDSDVSLREAATEVELREVGKSE